MILARLPVVDEQAATLAAWLPPVGMFGLFLEQNGCGPALKMPMIRALGMPMIGNGNAPPGGAAGRCGR
jgi:hypothetical protein